MSLRLSMTIQRAVRSTLIPSDALLRRYARAALAPLEGKVALTLRIVSEAESQQLNGQYRGKNKPTNVLSFPFDAPPDFVTPYLGDLVICAKVVQREAKEQQKKLPHHWAHMVVHGALHLLGYDHIKNSDAEEMEALERDILALLKIPDPYQNPIEHE
jgi:probable rRNA maturation factor